MSDRLRRNTHPGRAFGSTTDIFRKICALFTDYGLSEQPAKKLTYWVFNTWFADLFPLALCLVLSGPRPEATLVLQLMACIVRHGLPLADISLSGLLSLPMHAQPTLLISCLAPGMRKVLTASSYPRAYYPFRSGLVNLFCSKAVYAGSHLDALDSAFRVHLPPFHGRLPVLGDLAQRKLAADFQPLLLDYRMKYIGAVRDSDFDLPALDSELRMLARVLGSAIVNAPELREDLVNLLHEYQQEIAAGNAFNAESIVVEALFSYSHNEQCDKLVYVSQLADIANSILKDRGSREKLEPRALGSILRNSLGFAPKRNGRGFAITLTEDVRGKIHQIAREFKVPTVNEAATVCSQILTADGEEGSTNSELK